MSDTPGRGRLERQLGSVAIPDGIGVLDDDALGTLADLVSDARSTQHEALSRASDEGLRFIPRLIRGPVKKLLGL